MDEKFQQIMDAIQSSKREMQEELSSKLEKLQKEVTSGQESASQEVVKRIEKRSYQFRRKGNEEQFKFNASMEEHMGAAMKELGKLTPADEGQKAIVQRTTQHLDEGTKALAVRQKHIRIADRSDLGWAVVEAYMDDELASDSDDERKLFKASREAQQTVKRKRAESAAAAAAKRRAIPSGEPQPQAGTSQRFNQGFRPTTARPRMVGPCYRCGELGHLVASCPKPRQQYPFKQSLVKGTDIGTRCTTKECVDIVKGINVELPVWAGLSPEGVDRVMLREQGSIKCLKELCPAEEAGRPCIDSVERLAIDTDNDVPIGGEGKCWEAQEGTPGNQILDVQGRLKSNINFWRETLGAPAYVLDWIESGYKLPLRHLPEAYSMGNHNSAITHHRFVSNSITELLANRCIVKVTRKPHICSPLSVVTNTEGKLRLVLNLRYLNQFLHKVKFKYEDIRVALLMFTREDLLFKFDLKSGYHHLDIFEPHQKYLGFAWKEGEEIGYFVFTVLPFGLATACYAFTKLMRPLVRFWRGRGLRVVLYLDDGIVATKQEEANRESEQVQRDLCRAGLVTNSCKSQWMPSKRLIWLGFEVDLERGQLLVPQLKIDCLMEQMKRARYCREMPATVLASVIGRIMSMSLALGPLARMMTRSMYAVLNARSSWCHQVLLTPEALEELAFWLNNIDNFNGQNIWPKASAIRVVYSDASGSGYGGYCVEHGGHIATGKWSENEVCQSSTWRELRAVHLVLQDLGPKLKNHRVRWFTDNQNVARIVLIGSRKPILHEEAMAILSICLHQQIRLEPEWIPREENEFADYLSRIGDVDDWMLNPEVFQELDTRWGPHTIDRFADGYNCQLDRFNSRYWSPGTEAVDTFTCDWGGENNWWCPPLYLIPRLIRHAEVTKAQGTLVIPQWPSAPFWPLLFPSESRPAECVQQILELPRRVDLFLPGLSGSSVFKGTPNVAVLALRLKFGQ